MARGFESKQVESQQEAAASRQRLGPPVAPTDAARRAERATLTLARKRMEADLERATAPAHRDMIEHAIAELDRKLASLE